MKSFADLSEQEILALAINAEDEDARAYVGFAQALRDTYPASAQVFLDMAEQEHEHRREEPPADLVTAHPGVRRGRHA